jgi:FAD:protein FMN transferase
MMEYDDFSAMNTVIQVAAEGSPADLQPGFAQVRQFVAESEARFSRFLPSSELSGLNRSAGQWFQASPEMFEIIQEAMDLYVLTDGLFDPSIMNALVQAGYDRSMDEIRRMESVPMSSVSNDGRIPLDKILLEPIRQNIRLPAGMQIDLGGIAKGWIAAGAANLLAQYTDADTVSVGGDMVFVGLPTGETGWQVSLEDPCDEQRVLAVLNVGPGSLATSTVTRRRWMQGNQSRHHIIDPRSGAPAEVKWLSISVYTEKATYAEAFAKALLIAGPTGARALNARLPNLNYIAVRPDGSLVGTPASKELLYETG